MKRERDMEAIDTANCLMLLSKVGETDQITKRVFACKTCSKEFPSFQALGGHRASHKKPRLMGAGPRDHFFDQPQMPVSPKKPKTHECSICGLEFGLGQALGGHMRRHRAEAMGDSADRLTTRPLLSLMVPVLKKSNSIRVSCLDLNLMPNGDDLKLWVS